MTAVKALIFDCDGALFDSQQANLAYYNRVFTQFGYPSIRDPLSAEAHICHTASSPVVLASLMDVSVVDDALLFARGLDYREFTPLMIEARGLKQGLTRLADRMPLAVATNRGGSMQDVLKQFELERFFEVVVTSSHVKKPKPAPDMLLLAARQLGVGPQHCLFVGDSELDSQAAEAAGIPFVSYGGGVKAARSVNSHAELVALLLDSSIDVLNGVS